MQDDIAHEAETGKIYRSNYVDKHGRTVLVMRPGCQVVHEKLILHVHVFFCIYVKSFHYYITLEINSPNAMANKLNLF